MKNDVYVLNMLDRVKGEKLQEMSFKDYDPLTKDILRIVFDILNKKKLKIGGQDEVDMVKQINQACMKKSN